MTDRDRYKLYGSKVPGSVRDSVQLSKTRVLQVGGDAIELSEQEVENLRDVHGLDIRKMPERTTDDPDPDDPSGDNENDDDQDDSS